MIFKQPDIVRKYAIAVGRSPLLKKMFRPLYHTYIKWLENHRRTDFLKNGIRILQTFDECMTNNGFQYTLAFGTMLGAVREHGFIKHDLDIDVAMWAEDYTPQIRECLSSCGFKLYQELSVDDGRSAREETYELHGVAIDIFYIYPSIDQHPYCCDFITHQGTVSFEDSMKQYGYIIPRRLQLPWVKDFIRVPFENLQLPIPVNAHEILAYRYGEDYMTPKPDWHYTDTNQYIVVWKDKKGIAKHS